MAELIKPPRMFTPNEWLCANKNKYGMANSTRELAQGLNAECDRAIDEVKKRTEKTMNDVDKKLDQRLDDVAYWRGELDKKLQDNAEESKKLRECIVRLQKALAATCEPLHITNQCLLVRDERKGIDLVADDVHKNLLREVETIKGVQSLLSRTIEQATEQYRLNQKSAFNLKKDHVGKQSAFNLDEYGRTVSSYAENIPDAKKESPDFAPSFSPAEWQTFTQNNLEMADKQLQNSHQMRNLIEGILIQVAEDQKKQVADTNWALKKRITEVRDAKGKLEEHLALTLKEISDMEDNITELKSAIRALSKPAAVTETRQNLRDVRPGVELCRDAPFYRQVGVFQ
ncbi:unnamed protein product [Dibothriocephalus latus]|uniref:Tektin n=1 Tax=Dibothriocephalus latus TaxID=60516 RepID=A0A3P7LHU2_DIBLA|nr:unnamed protein product [Dibothriocephalus latus]